MKEPGGSTLTNPYTGEHQPAEVVAEFCRKKEEEYKLQRLAAAVEESKRKSAEQTAGKKKGASDHVS